MQHVALGALVMLTENIDLKVGATNGTTGIVTKLEVDLKDNVYSISIAHNPLGYVQTIRKNKFKQIWFSRIFLQNIISSNFRLCNYKT
jgi:hypothetical protein